MVSSGEHDLYEYLVLHRAARTRSTMRWRLSDSASARVGVSGRERADGTT